MINYNEPGQSKTPTNITHADKLLTDLNYVTEKYSIQTARSKLNNFKFLMLNMPTNNVENPYLSLKAMDALNISEELYYVYSKMAYFLKAERYIFLGDDIPRSAGKNHVNYHYNIPLLAMPLVIAFIASIHEKKSSVPFVKSFFLRMDNYIVKYPFQKILEEYPQYSKEELLNSYHDWMHIYLGRDYFSHLEYLFDECSTNEFERNSLKLATSRLTQLAAFPNRKCKANINKLDDILQEYTKALKQKALKTNSGRLDYSSLYEQWEAFPIKLEITFIDKICTLFNDFFNHLKAEINEYLLKNHKVNSQYTLALQNIENFMDHKNYWTESIKNIQLQLADLILDHYRNLHLHQDIMQLIDQHNLQIQNTNISYKIRKLFEILIGALSETEDILDKLLKYVTIASGSTPQNYSAKTTEYISSINILNKISVLQKRALEEIKDSDFPKKYPSLFHHKVSYVCEQGFAYYTLDEAISAINEKVSAKEDRNAMTY